MSLRILFVAGLSLSIPSLVLGQAAPSPQPPAAAPVPVAAPAAAPVPVAAPAAAPEAQPATIIPSEPAAPAAATPAPTVAPPPEPIPMQAPAVAELAVAQPPVPEAAPSEPPKKLSVGTSGLFQPGFLLQGWFLVDGADKTTTTFRARRAELQMKGDILPGEISYVLMIDAAKVLEPANVDLPVANQSPAASDPKKPETVTAKQPVSPVSMLQDVYVTFASEYVDTSLGQFKIPVSWEGYTSSSKSLFAERALASREFGDKRDLGLRLAKTTKYFGYSAGLFNGAGANNLDADNGKDGALRLEGYPVDGLVLAGVVYGTLWERHKSGHKDRLELDARYDLGPVLIQAEYIHASDALAASKATVAQGFYAAVAVRLLDDKLEPAIRVGYLDPNVDTDVDPTLAKGKDEVWHIEGGLTYYIQKQEAKVILDYARFEFDDKTANNEVIAAAQVSY
jgi:hypothetical protein